VLRIARTYDPNGALASVTSYDANTGGSAVNVISYTRDAWGNVTASAQDPNADGGTVPSVGYTWGYGLSGDAASYARLEKITLLPLCELCRFGNGPAHARHNNGFQHFIFKGFDVQG